MKAPADSEQLIAAPASSTSTQIILSMGASSPAMSRYQGDPGGPEEDRP
jgi:hypothetical protein